MKTCKDYKQEILDCIEHIKTTNYREKYDTEDDFELEDMWYEYKSSGFSYFLVTINNKLYYIAPWENTDLDFVKDNIDSITYVLKDALEDTVVGNVEDFTENISKDLLGSDYLRYVERVNGIFTEEEITNYLAGLWFNGWDNTNGVFDIWKL